MTNVTAKLEELAGSALAAAEGALAHGDHVRNADHWAGPRDPVALASFTEANAHATVALAHEVARLTETVAQAVDWLRESRP